MSFLGDVQPIPEGHPSGDINAPQTLDMPKAFGTGRAEEVRSDPAVRSRPVAVSKTNRGIEMASKTGKAHRVHTHSIPSRNLDVHVRSGNQRGSEVGVPQGDAWALQGEGDAVNTGFQLPIWAKLGGAAVIAYFAWKTLRG